MTFRYFEFLVYGSREFPIMPQLLQWFILMHTTYTYGASRAVPLPVWYTFQRWIQAVHMKCRRTIVTAKQLATIFTNAAKLHVFIILLFFNTFLLLYRGRHAKLINDCINANFLIDIFQKKQDSIKSFFIIHIQKSIVYGTLEGYQIS